MSPEKLMMAATSFRRAAVVGDANTNWAWSSEEKFEG
jgi:hypothetical protein